MTFLYSNRLINPLRLESAIAMQARIIRSFGLVQIWLTWKSRLLTDDQGFETRTEPYGPIEKTSNRLFLRFFKPQEPFYGKKIENRKNRGQTSWFWELWSNCFSRFPTSLLNLNFF